MVKSFRTVYYISIAKETQIVGRKRWRYCHLLGTHELANAVRRNVFTDIVTDKTN